MNGVSMTVILRSCSEGRGHDGGHAAAKADEHGHEAAAGEAQAPQQLVHHEGHARHVAGVLEDREQDEEDHDDRQEREHAAHAGEDAVDHEAVHHGVEPEGRERGVNLRRHPVNAQGEKVGEPLADDVEREPEDERHDGDEDRDGGVAAREDAVGRDRARVLAALARLDHALGADALDEREAHVRQGRHAVAPGLPLHLADDVLDGVELVLVQPEGVHDQPVPLDELGRGEAHREVGRGGVVLDDVADAVDAAVQGAVVGPVRRAEVHAARMLAEARHVQDVLDELGDALLARRGDGHHGDAERGLQTVHAHRAAVGRELVHHVEGEDHGPVQLHELERQVEVALDVGGVHDVDDRVRVVLEDEAAGDHLLARVRGERVDAREVGDRGLGMTLDLAVLAVHRDAREVAHVLVGAREGVEERGLAAVLVAGERQFERTPLGDRRAGRARRVLLADGGMLRGLQALAALREVVHVVHLRERDVRGVVATQGELVAAQTDLQRVAHGGALHERDLHARREAHVEDVLAQRRLVAVNRRHDRVLADSQLVQVHQCPLSLRVRTQL